MDFICYCNLFPFFPISHCIQYCWIFKIEEVLVKWNFLNFCQLLFSFCRSILVHLIVRPLFRWNTLLRLQTSEIIAFVHWHVYWEPGYSGWSTIQLQSSRLSFFQGIIRFEECWSISSGADGEGAAVAAFVAKFLVSSESMSRGGGLFWFNGSRTHANIHIYLMQHLKRPPSILHFSAKSLFSFCLQSWWHFSAS